MGIESHPAYQEEERRLKETLQEATAQLRELAAQTGLEGQELNDEGLEAIRAAAVALEQMRIDRIYELRTAQMEPYFGRIDFQESGKGRTEPLYIGKTGMELRETKQPYVIDWRAPVATLFYTAGSEGEEEAWYEAPGGVIRGAVHLKRNLGVKGAQLQRIVDSKLQGEGDAVIDEFLQYRLEESRDSRLRDIVSTIQKEQNAIIRADRDGPVIIQGVAGSGKTTVALHRIAYLLYHFRGAISPERILILAPNRMFLDYISDVLPELGVGAVRQSTFSDWAIDQIEPLLRLTDPGARLAHWFQPTAGEASVALAPGRFKGSLHFKEVLRRAVAAYAASFVPDADVTLWEGARVPAQEIRSWFYEQFVSHPLGGRRDRCIARIKRWADDHVQPYKGTLQELERRKAARSAVQRWANLWPKHDALELYRQILGAPPGKRAKVARVGAPDIPVEVMRDSLALFARGEVAPEDLAPLVYLQGELDGLRDRALLDHVVIDEAQDFSPFQIDLLRSLIPNHSFTILGDLSQSIHLYQGIHSWEELMEVFPDGECRYFTLDQSYRSTYEVMTFANAVLSAVGAPAALARPVFRAGDKVRVGPLAPTTWVAGIAGEINRMHQQRCASIAVITRTGEESERLAEGLATAGIAAHLITPAQTRYRGGVSVMPSYLAKGLEFDGVIIADASAPQYGWTTLDARLLYVAATRALHSLTLFHTDEPTPLLGAVDPTLYEAFN